MTGLRCARLRSGLSLQEAADKAGISVSYLRKLERVGSAELAYPRARRLATLYGVDLITLTFGERFSQTGRGFKEAIGTARLRRTAPRKGARDG